MCTKRGLAVELVGSAPGGLLFPRGKSNQKRARNRMVSGLPFPPISGIFGKPCPKLSIVCCSAPLPLTVQNFRCSVLTGGAMPTSPRNRRTDFYILKDQRQRRRSRDDTTSKAPCKAPPNVWDAPQQYPQSGAR